MIDGVRLSKAKRFRYKHMDMEDLEIQLKEAKKMNLKNVFVITDGVFSMDGDIAPLDKIVDLAHKYNALTYVDECHATGFIGKSGVGTPELFNVMEKVDVISGTLGKALGGASGGYTTGRKEIIQMLRQKSRPYLFSNSLAPPIVGATLKVFEIMEKNP